MAWLYAMNFPSFVRSMHSKADLDEKMEFCDVWYKGMPRIGHNDVRDMVDGKCCFLTKEILRSKDPCWKYENEVRIIAKDGMESPFIDLYPKATIVGIKDFPECQVLCEISNQFKIPFGFLCNRPHGMPGFVVSSQEHFVDYLSY